MNMTENSYNIEYGDKIKVRDPDDFMGEKTIDSVRFKIVDRVGGTMGGYISNNDTAHITSMRSIPQGVSHEDSEKYKKRGFFKGALTFLKGRRIKSIVINLQSSDTREAIKRLISTGLLKNPREMAGGSFDSHPTKFDI